jgi:hypothetical protein
LSEFPYVWLVSASFRSFHQGAHLNRRKSLLIGPAKSDIEFVDARKLRLLNTLGTQRYYRDLLVIAQSIE